MNLADHLRPLLRAHDCVIIPDFGGLVADYAPAQVRPGSRHLLLPPSRQVAFNQALTRNDGLLVDALRQHLGLTAAEAREAVRVAVAGLRHELQVQQRTELPGIGVWRQQPGRGLQFDYTGAADLLPAAFGLPELTAHPVRVTDARQVREQQTQLAPRLRSAGQGLRWRRVVPGAAVGLLAGIAVAAVYLLGQHPDVLPVAWRAHLPRFEQFAAAPAAATQQAALAQPGFGPVAQPATTAEAAARPDTAGFGATGPAPAALEATADAPAPTNNSWDTPPNTTAATSAPAADDFTVAAPAAPTDAPETTSKAAPAASPAAVAVTKAAAAPAAPKAAKPLAVTALAARPVAARVALPRQDDPVAALLAKPSRQAPPPAKKGKVPASAAIALGNGSNVARPVPLAQRKTVTPPNMTTAYATVASPTLRPMPAVAAALPALRPDARKKPAAKAVAVQPAAKPVAKAAAASMPVAPVAAAPVAAVATTGGAVKQRTGRFYVIVAAYNSLAHAETGRRNLEHAGRPAKVIMPPAGSRLYRLSAADFADKPTAQLAAARLRQNPHFDKGITVMPY